MKFDICDVFSQDEYDEIRKFLLEKIRNVPDEATISDASMELHKIVEEVLPDILKLWKCEDGELIGPSLGNYVEPNTDWT